MSEDGTDDVFAQAVPVGEELRDGGVESLHVELPTRVLVRPPVALGVGVVPQAAAEADSESERKGRRLTIIPWEIRFYYKK